MNRNYDVQETLELIDKINNKFELPFIGSDVIAGFAGETDEDFEITCNNLKNSGLSQIHTFPYSIRKGTVGAEMPNQVDDKVKEYRANVIKEISKQKYLDFVNKNLGTTQEILVEKHPDKHSGYLKGITRNFLTVNIDSGDLNLTNTIQNIKIKDYNGDKIFAELCYKN